jgi:hypothetical protein
MLRHQDLAAAIFFGSSIIDAKSRRSKVFPPCRESHTLRQSFYDPSA